MIGETQSDYKPPAIKADAKAKANAKANAKAKVISPRPPNKSFFRYSLHYRYQYREGRLVAGQEDGPKNVRHPDRGRTINQKSWHYDKNGRISEYRYRYFRTRYQFDGAGRLLSRLTRPGDNSLRFVHDQAGRVIEARDRAWVYRFVWNAAGRLAGRTSEYVDGGGYSRYSYHYDSAGRLVERRQYGRKSTQPESTERYEYCDAK